jgi:hypothetical protein
VHTRTECQHVLVAHTAVHALTETYLDAPALVVIPVLPSRWLV